ncbi:MAG: hypothetical protein HYY67_06550 [Thaumarchaeota archaeon]|nr:hypothetical protein [Nitrososphaerota archaeon]
MTLFANRAALALTTLSMVLILFHFGLPMAEATAEQEARYRQEKMGDISDNLRSIGLRVLGPLLAGGVAILIVQRVGKNQANRSRSWLVGLVVALGTFGLIYFV